MVQRLTYRKRHSYATKSNQHRVVKTPGDSSVKPLVFLFFSILLHLLVYLGDLVCWSERVFELDFINPRFVLQLVLKSEIFFFSASIWKWFLFIFYFLCIWSGLNEMWFVCRRKVGVSEHQEEGQWSQMPSYWEENPRGMPFLWLFDSSLVSVVSVLMCRYCVCIWTYFCMLGFQIWLAIGFSWDFSLLMMGMY